MKFISLLFIAALCASLLSFTFGGDSYTIHLNNRKVADHYVFSKAAVPSLVLTSADKNAQLSVYYSECGKIGKERVLTLKNDEQKILKTWNFPNAIDEHIPMTINTTELFGLMKTEKVHLYYSSRDTKSAQVLASITSSVVTAGKK